MSYMYFLHVVVDCGFLHNPDNGQVETSSGTTYTSSATYTCDRGYILNGDVSRTCHHNQSWIPMAPVCIRTLCIFMIMHVQLIQFTKCKASRVAKAKLLTKRTFELIWK